MYFCSLFCNGEERQAICFWNQTWSLPFKLLPIPRWKGALSNANKFTHIPKAEKQVLWRFFPPLINEEMEHILTKSSEQGWQSRCDHANRSGSYSDGKQVTTSRTKHSHQPEIPLHLCKRRWKMQKCCVPPQLNKCFGSQNCKYGLEAAAGDWLCWWPSDKATQRLKHTKETSFVYGW